VHTTAADVGQLLASRGYRVNAHDLVAPAPSSALHSGEQVVLRRGRLLHLVVDGQRRDVWTTAGTVQEALAQLGYSTQDFVSVSRSQRLPLGVSALTIRTPHRITIVQNGVHSPVTTTDATVGAALADLGIAVGPDVRVRPRLATPTADGQVVRIQDVTRRTVVRRQPVGYPTKHRKDASLLVGHTKVVQPGERGLLTITYSVVYLDGKEVARTKLGTAVVRSPRTEIIASGTRQPPAQPASTRAGGGGGGAPRAGVPSPGSAKAIARQMLAARGWGSQDQYDCLVTLWDHESGWRVNAYNPSGAYGIPQALPGSKMASAGPDWQTNASTQIRWGLNYIASRYGTPCGAWSQWQANGGWY
jgi:uncharacterized protein YabE (DUF348 family)